jgi:MraZ protein
VGFRGNFWQKSGKSMFNGAVSITLDPKGRFSMPTRHRDALAVACKGVGANALLAHALLTITKHQDGCLMIFPSPEWQTVSARIATWSTDALAWKRYYLGNATEVEMDGTGRILLPSDLRTSMGIVKDATLVGMETYFELWDSARLAEHEAKTLQGDRPPEVKGFSF